MDITTFLNKVNQFILNPVILLLFVVALVCFFWGLFQFIGNAGSDEGRETGKRNIVWGVIGMFIMVAVFGIIKIVLKTFDIGPPPGSNPYIPQLFNYIILRFFA